SDVGRRIKEPTRDVEVALESGVHFDAVCAETSGARAGDESWAHFIAGGPPEPIPGGIDRSGEPDAIAGAFTEEPLRRVRLAPKHRIDPLGEHGCPGRADHRFEMEPFLHPDR